MYWLQWATAASYATQSRYINLITWVLTWSLDMLSLNAHADILLTDLFFSSLCKNLPVLFLFLPSCHQPLSLPPTLLGNPVHLAFAYGASQLASPSSKFFWGLLQRNWWLGEDYMHLPGSFFACTNRGYKHTKMWPTTIDPTKCHLPSRLLADVLLQILRQLCKLAFLPAWAVHLCLNPLHCPVFVSR